MKPVPTAKKRFSMTYRLPATYAAIALLVALSLGAVLQTTLRTRFAAQERDYLESNAEPMAANLSMIMPQDNIFILEEQVHFFSFLIRAKVDVFDTQGLIIASADIFDDGRFTPPEGFVSRGFSGQFEPANNQVGFAVAISPQGAVNIIEEYPMMFYPEASGIEFDTTSAILFGFSEKPSTELQMQIAPSVFGYNIGRNERDEFYREIRSDQIVEQIIMTDDGIQLGILRLSEGPAYGVSLVRGIMSGWLLASIVSVALAILVSWFVSRDVVHPLISLSKTTQQMAAGDLSARAGIKRSDEFGTLSQSFNHMAQRIEETVSTLQHFVSDAAHEIHTPITALRTNLELLEGEADKETVDRALGQLKRLENLAKNLLQLSRLESAMDTVKVEAVDLVGLAREIAQFHASQVEQAGIHLVMELPDKAIWVQANETQFQQALSNLLNNAIKFTPNDGTITIKVQQNADKVYLSVEDTGIGIPEADLSFLFNRFHRGRNATRYAGSGLGLTIVQAIVQGFDGQVSAENMPHGARFTITLPEFNIF